jgi:F0F1-type ATP synthase membrane subunit b/b'
MSSTPEQRAHWRAQAKKYRDQKLKKAKKEKPNGVDHVSKDAIVYLRHATDDILADLRAHPHKKFKRSELLTFLALSTLE